MRQRLDDSIPLTKKVEIEDRKLAILTARRYALSGADNFCEAKTLRLLAYAVSNSDKQALLPLQPAVNIKMNVQAWAQAYHLVVSYLKSHKMEQTLRTVLTEYPKVQQPRIRNKITPKLVEKYFTNIFLMKPIVRDRTFDQKVEEFMEDLKIEDVYQESPIKVRGWLLKKKDTATVATTTDTKL